MIGQRVKVFRTYLGVYLAQTCFFMSASSNGDSDLDILLCHVSDLCHGSQQVTVETKTCEPLLPTQSDPTPSFVMDDAFDVPEEKAFIYLCGYLVKVILAQHPCAECRTALQATDDLDSMQKLLVHFKSFDDSGCKLCVPSELFSEYIRACEDVFIQNVNTSAFHFNVGKGLSSEIKHKVPFPFTCPSFPIEFTLALDARVRLYYGCKFFNRGLLSAGGKQRKFFKVCHL